MFLFSKPRPKFLFKKPIEHLRDSDSRRNPFSYFLANFSAVKQLFLKGHFILYLKATLFLSWLHFLKGSRKYSVNSTLKRSLGSSIIEVQKLVFLLEDRYNLDLSKQKILKKTKAWVIKYKKRRYTINTAADTLDQMKHLTSNLALEISKSLIALEKSLDRFGCIKTIKKVSFTYRFRQSKNN